MAYFDADMSKYIHISPNLELMKLSSYYKKRGDIVSLSPLFSPNMYNKFIYRKDYYDGFFPPEILSSDIIEYGGRAFNVDNYESLPLEIEKQKPDIYIYESFRKKFCINKEKERDFRTMLNAEHFRLSLDGKNIWNDFDKQITISSKSHTLFLHDYNLNDIENSDIIIKELMNNMSKNHRHLATKFPIKVSNEKDLYKWILPFSPSKKYFTLQYCGVMEDELLVDFIINQKYKRRTQQLEYFVNENILEEDFINFGINRLYKQIIYLKINKQNITLKYNPNNFTDKRWCRIIDLFNAYLIRSSNLKSDKYLQVYKYDTLYNYILNLKEKRTLNNENFIKPEVRELFQFVRERNYELFRDFYECKMVTLKGGKLQNE